MGFQDSSAVSVVSGHDLSLLYGADTRQVTHGNLGAVAWSRDGQRLYAGGRFLRDGIGLIFAWPQQGRGAPTLLEAATSTVMDLAALSDGGLVFASFYSAWGVIGANGERERLSLPAGLDHRGNQAQFHVSRDGRQVEFQFDIWDGHDWQSMLARFDLDRGSLETDVTPAQGLSAPRTEGLPVSNWEDSVEPKFQGERIELKPYEQSGSLAITRDASGFVLGTDWSLRGFDAAGHPRWAQSVPDAAWAVNLSDDGRWVVAALGDGTIRWYEAGSGRERLALFIHARDQRWVLWTPEGFYQASSPQAETLIGYHLNQGREREGQFVEAAQLASVFYRPDLITRRLAGDEAAISEVVQRIGDVRSVLAGGLPPRVELLSLTPVVEGGDEYELSVRITPASGGVGALKLLINGAQVPAARDVPPGGGIVTQRVHLAPGRNEVGVLAARSDGKVDSTTASAVVNVKEQTRPVLRVLAVGASQYDDAIFNEGVKFAARDAQDLGQRLRAGASEIYREVDIKVLNRREDTKLARIEEEIVALSRRARPEDVVVIFLAGHGKAVDGVYHFIPADFLYDSDKAYNHGTLSQSKLEALLKSLGAGKRVLILDTCGSGAALATRAGGEEKDAIARLMRSSGRYILAAASPLGKALEDGQQGHGIYSFALMEGLAGAADRPPNGNGNGLIEVDELANYVARRVPELTARFGYRQVPMRGGWSEGESFWLTRTPKQP